MDHTEWMQTMWGDESVRSAARRSGIAPRSLANYVDRGELPAEAVIAIALAYGKHPVGALVSTGYLAEEFAREIDPITALREVSDEQIADEVLRRMKLGGEHAAFETPIDEMTDSRDAEVHNLPMRPDGVLDTSRMRGAASRRVKEVYPETPDEGL
ncbi:hypothetical protein ACFWQG_13250 [Rhodococcus sp. NPDC058532]|uniref:hypothetical protein n=1 Tax=Rhodococcus sp. NPDC058532 TaxID=3346540 RepID=UPI00364631BE